MNALPRGDGRASIAVIVPVLNESANIAALLADLAQHDFSEVIVVDGGSTDGTAEAVEPSKSARLLRTARGRGLQLNAGAAAAMGADILLFLHADTRLPADACERIRGVLDDPRSVAGCFRLAFDARQPLLDLYARASAFESAFTSFGDQAFFVRASVFLEVGGFPDWPFLEDVEMRRRLRRRGKFVKADATVVTSARRFQSEGIVRRQLLNFAILCAFLAGVPAHRLARWYAPHSPLPKS